MKDLGLSRENRRQARGSRKLDLLKRALRVMLEEVILKTPFPPPPKDRERDRQTDKQTDRDKERDRERGRQKHRHRERQTQRETETEKETETNRQRETKRQTDRQRDTQRDRERQREKERERERSCSSDKIQLRSQSDFSVGKVGSRQSASWTIAWVTGGLVQLLPSLKLRVLFRRPSCVF